MSACGHELCAETPQLPCAQTYTGGEYLHEALLPVSEKGFWTPDMAPTQIHTRLWRLGVIAWRDRRWFFWRAA
jgi:hypothetical protein